jgi:hypothetical protein
MEKTMDLKTRRELLAAIRKAKEVHAMLWFGCAERHVKISKAEARSFVMSVMTPEATPADMEMYGGERFGELTDEGILYLG